MKALAQVPEEPGAWAISEQQLLFPFLGLKVQYAGIRGEIISAITKVLDNQNFILGHEVSSLEAEIGRLIGSRFAVGCASGSDALLLALMVMNVGVGDEVITTPFTFVATAGSIARLGARPVFVDIDPKTFALDWGRVAAAFTPKTKAIIAVHLFGLAAEIDKLMEISYGANIPVVEDAAQSIWGPLSGPVPRKHRNMWLLQLFPIKTPGGRR